MTTLILTPADVHELRFRWTRLASRAQFGVCHQCGRHHDANGKPLVVARQPREHHFRCFDCFLNEVMP